MEENKEVYDLLKNLCEYNKALCEICLEILRKTGDISKYLASIEGMEIDKSDIYGYESEFYAE